MRPGALVLVTGANGFVGSHLTERLLERGYSVRCMVRRTSDLTFVRGLAVEWAYADLREDDCLFEVCQGVDAVCHCAALTRALDPETFMRVNAQGAELLARTCLEAATGLQRFLFVSSQTAAGPSRGPDDYMDESRPPQPLTWYGKSKLAAEQALLGMADRLPLTIIRPAAIFGPRDRDFLTYFALIKRGLNLQLAGGERQNSLIYVHDLVSLILLALESDKALGHTYFGSGLECRQTELASSIARALRKRTLRLTLPQVTLALIGLVSRLQVRVTHRPPLLNDRFLEEFKQPYWLCSGERARHDLGFSSGTDLDTATQETADWYLANRWL